MSEQYDEYLKEHRENVAKAYDWMAKNLPELRLITINLPTNPEYLCKYDHDKSKVSKEEYDAYDKYFYGNNKSYYVVQDYNRAWLHHIHNNPHHWQYWLLFNSNDTITALEMPDEYVIEMICDWWSFNWKSGNLKEIFSWYEANRDNMTLHYKTRQLVETILMMIGKKLYSEEANEKWKWDWPD